MLSFYRLLPIYWLLLLALPATAQKHSGGKPDWVTKKPSDPATYYGIGSAPMTDANYAANAKSSALGDMASEIVINLNATTIDSSVQENDKVSQKFTSAVKAITDNNLEGYENVGSWSGDGTYWTLYKLNKDLYLQNKRQRFATAVQSSQDLFARGQALEQSGDIYQSFLLYTQSLQPLQPYLVAVLEPEFKAKSAPQANQVTSKLINLLSNITFTAKTPEVAYKFGSRQDVPLEVLVTYKQGGQVVPVEKLPVKYSFVTGKGKFLSDFANSDASGIARAVLNSVEPSKGAILVKAELSTADFPVLTDPNIALFSIGNVSAPKAQIRIKGQGPSVILVAEENKFSSPLPQHVLEPMIKDFLISKGCTVNPPTVPSDYVITLKSDTRQGTSTQGVYTALMDLSVSAVKSDTQEEVASMGLDDLKGTKFDYDNASFDCYTKARKKLQDEFLPTFAGKLFN